MKLPKDATKPKHITVFKSGKKKDLPSMGYRWWEPKSQEKRAAELIASAVYLRENQRFRDRQTAAFARLYGNQSLYSFVGSNLSKIDQASGLPADRPTFNVIQSATDTLVSRISQNRPSPVFLTDNSDYKERKLAKQLNHFISGEYYQTESYDKAAMMLRDALVLGTGILHVYETQDQKVGVETVLLNEVYVDLSEAMYGYPRRMYRIKLVDREVLASMSPKFKAKAEAAENSYIDNSGDAARSVADLVLVVEGWSLPSGKDMGDGRHTIACSSGVLLDEEYTKDKFPFVFLHYSKRLRGFWSQGLAEQLMGTQLEINSLLYTISRSIKLMGVPKILMEAGSKIMSTAFNNEIGSIIKYSGTAPIFETNQSNAPELYQQLQRMIEYAFQQCGVSAMQATSQKPAGLNSGEAQRVYDDISTDRFASLSKKYDNVFVDLAYLVTDLAKDIATREGKYQTIYPSKDGTKQIDLPEMDILKDPFVIQCFNTSALPRDPAGRKQTVVEWIQSGIVDIKEGRRLLNFPDLDQFNKLEDASQERIYQTLDDIVEEGKYTPPDPFMDLQLGIKIATQYYNVYASCKLEEDRLEMIRTFFTQCQALVVAATPPAPAAPQPGAAPMAAPEAQAQSPMVPNGSIG